MYVCMYVCMYMGQVQVTPGVTLSNIKPLIIF